MSTADEHDLGHPKRDLGHAPTSLLLSKVATGFAIGSTIAGVYSIAHANLNVDYQRAAVVVLLFAITIVVLMMAISQTLFEREYGTDPLRGITVGL